MGELIRVATEGDWYGGSSHSFGVHTRVTELLEKTSLRELSPCKQKAWIILILAPASIDGHECRDAHRPRRRASHPRRRRASPRGVSLRGGRARAHRAPRAVRRLPIPVLHLSSIETSGIVTAGWNDFTWGAGSVVSNTPASKDGGLHSIVLKVDNEMAKGYATPGQFCQLRTSDDGKPAFIAIASPPDADGTTFELLVKRQEGTAGEICDMAGGDTIQMSPPMGPGFDMNKAPADQFPDTLLFATGSGISPIRALIKSGALAGRNVTLYYGTAAPSYTAFIDEFKEWEAAGVTVEARAVASRRSPYVRAGRD